jgi:hypothetical protein
MASHKDARAGWEIYRNSGFSLTRQQINQRLRSLGYSPIAPRTYLHYQRLERRGFRRYMSINRLDTMQVPDPFADDSIRSRHAYTSADIPVQLIVHRPTAQGEIFATADVLSDFGTELVITDNEQIAGFTPGGLPARTPVTVNFLDPPSTIYGRIDFVSTVEPDVIRIGVIFERLTDVQVLTGQTKLGTQSCYFSVGENERRPSLEVVSQDVYWLFNALESSRAIVNNLLGLYGAPDLSVAIPAVEHLKVASPLETWIQINGSVFLVIHQVLDRLESTVTVGGALVRTWTAMEARQAKAERERAEAEYIRQLTEGLKISNDDRRLASDLLGSVAANIVEPLIEHAGREARARPEAGVEAVLSLVLKDFLPAVSELQRRGLVLSDDPPPLPASED